MTSIRVVGWDHRGAVAIVDDVRCRIRRRVHETRWICDQHGTQPTPHCHHLQALANQPADPAKEVR